MQETFVPTLYDDLSESPSIAPFETRLRSDANQLEVDVPKGESVTDMISALSAVGIKVGSIRAKSNRLEEFFLRLVNQNGGERS